MEKIQSDAEITFGAKEKKKQAETVRHLLSGMFLIWFYRTLCGRISQVIFGSSLLVQNIWF